MKCINKFCSPQFWKFMKLCTTQIILATVIVGLSIAHENRGQVLDREVTLSLTDVSFQQALFELGAATHTKFAYSPEQLNIKQQVSIHANHQALRDVLSEFLTPLNISYVVHRDNTTISLKKSLKAKAESQQTAPSPEKDAYEIPFTGISGTVTDASGQPIAGVNIVIKGTTKGTTSSTDGTYAIDADANDILVFSFIGFTPQEIRVGTQSTIAVILQEDIKSLNEVVVNVGYWEVKQKEQTGNVSRITAKEIEKQIVNNPLQAIQGRMTGVYVQQNTGIPGGGFSIQVRGRNSLRTGANRTVDGNLPLYLIDGVPFTSTSLISPTVSGSNLSGGNPLSTINPNDIESIEVLKDADATAIYGSRGANGVILITTKRAKSGKTKLDLDMYQGIGQVSGFMNLLNSDQYRTMRKEGFANDGRTPTLTNAPDLVAWDSTRYTDWQQELIGGTAHLTNAQMSLSGGNDKTQFIFAGGYYRETTVFPGDNSFKRGTGRLAVNHQSENAKFKIQSAINFSSSLSDIPSADFTSQAITLSPNAPALFDPNGKLNWENGTWSNPLAALQRKYTNTIENFVSNVNASYEIVPGLTIKSGLGYTSMSVAELRTSPLSAIAPDKLSGKTASSTFGDSNLKTWIAEPQLVFVRPIGQGMFTAMAGSTFQQSIQNGTAITASGYTNDALLENLSAATTIRVGEETYSQYRYTAVFGRLNYNWKEKYLLNLTGRRDGSSRFGPGNRFANFGAIGAAWIFTNEEFISNNIPILSFGKIRSSYGATGNDAVGNYQFMETYSVTSYPYAGSPGMVLTRLANPDYSWETNKKFELGLELGLLKDRLLFSTSYYLNRASGQLVGLPLPAITGQSSVQFNFPATVQNSGLEVQLTSTNIQGSHLTWTTNVNLTLPSNKLLEFPNIEAFPAYTNKYDVGASTFQYKGYQYQNVDPITGLYTMVDLNEDGAISKPADAIGLKKVTQTFYGGIGNTVTYKNFQLDFLFQFVKQTGYDYQQSFTIPGMLSNQPTVVMERWQQENQNSNVQKFTALDPTSAVTTAYYLNASSDNIVTDASFVRLKSLSLSYLLPDQWFEKIPMQGSRIFLQGQNLLTFTNYIGMDPETQLSQSLPPLRMISAGIHLTFK